ncbi:MAG: hypothetical protein HY924_02965 [Elusimicrobia bacterium]|nr:hypothetical protein [Elusimicrobiota bacterium]
MSLPGRRDDRLSRRLKALPRLKAPAGLLPRVMASAASLPWWKRAWWTWPVVLRFAYAGLLALPAALILGWLMPSMQAAVDLSFHSVEAALSGWWKPLATVGRGLGLALAKAKTPLLAAAFLSYLSSVAAASAINRLWSAAIPRRMS